MNLKLQVHLTTASRQRTRRKEILDEMDGKEGNTAKKQLQIFISALGFERVC